MCIPICHPDALADMIHDGCGMVWGPAAPSALRVARRRKPDAGPVAKRTRAPLHFDQSNMEGGAGAWARAASAAVPRACGDGVAAGRGKRRLGSFGNLSSMRPGSHTGELRSSTSCPQHCPKHVRKSLRETCDSAHLRVLMLARAFQNLGQTRPTSDHFRPNSAHSARLAQFWPLWAQSSEHFTNFGRSWWNLPQIRPTPAYLGRTSPDLGRVW